MIRLRTLSDNDINLFKNWLNHPHIAEWYHEPLDWIFEIEKRNEEFVWLHHFIVEVENKPIGFCQYYEYKNSGETWHGDTEIDGTYSIDYMIGEIDYLNKGYGKQIINTLIDKVKLIENARRIIVQPELENKASCGVLLSCGFVFDAKSEVYILELHCKNTIIRPIAVKEILLLTDFLYEAIFQRENEPRISRTVLQEPSIWIYIDEFGRKKDDHCLVAELNGKIIGAIWVRCIKAYGFFNENIPELAMSLYPEYRGKGLAINCLTICLNI